MDPTYRFHILLDHLGNQVRVRRQENTGRNIPVWPGELAKAAERAEEQDQIPEDGRRASDLMNWFRRITI